MWESEINGILLNKNKDFVLLNREGINLIGLGSVQKKACKDAEGTDRMMHTLESCNFLKVDNDNYLLFACQNMQKREISVQ